MDVILLERVKKMVQFHDKIFVCYDDRFFLPVHHSARQCDCDSHAVMDCAESVDFAVEDVFAIACLGDCYADSTGPVSCHFSTD